MKKGRMMPIQIKAEPLDGQGWSSFGWIPVRDTDPRDGLSRLVFEWGDAHLNIISHRLEELVQTDTGLVCDNMSRHLTHTQALLVLNCLAVIAVAPPSSQLSGPEDLDQVRAFLLSPLDSFVLHQGTWHWGPFPVSDPQVDLFNIQGWRYAEDNDNVKLAGRGAAFEVVMGGA
jgi:ureidoglycolate hydrolase